MKRFLALFLALALMVSGMSLAVAEGYAPGTYEASAQGFGGAVTVKVTVDEAGKIVELSVTGDDETPGIGDKAIAAITDAVLERGGIEDFDALSVATAKFTAQGVMDALEAALAQASGETAEAAELAFTAGTYAGSAAGYNGDVTVEVTFSDSAVTEIKVVASAETEHVGDVAYAIMIDEIIEANGTGVDSVSGATFSSRALRNAVNAAAEAAGCTNLSAFQANTVAVEAKAPMDVTYDVVIVGAGGAGIAAAAQAAQDGNTVLVIEKNAEVGGNTLVSGGQYQSVMPYLCWDPADPDAVTGVSPIDGNTYDKVMSEQGCIDELKHILEWNEDAFDEAYYVDNEYVAGDMVELSKHGVHADYLPVLQDLKAEIKEYLDWAQPKLDAGTPENQLPLFSTLNLHIFQTYYGGLRQSADKSEWIYGDVALVSQFIVDGQEIKPWLMSMGSKFLEGQPTLIGALWFRENEYAGADVDTDGDGETEFYADRWGSYFVAPMTAFKNANEQNQIMLRTDAQELIVEDGRVTGVKAVQYDGTEVTAHATKGVILATGGYAANINVVVKENVYWSSDYLSTSTKTTNRNSLQGDGIAMAAAIGGATTGMGFTQLMPISWIDNGNLAFGGGNYACWINPTTGHRFVDEGSERDVLSLAEFRNGVEMMGSKGVFVEFYNATERIPGPPSAQLGEEDFEGRYFLIKANEQEIGELFAKLGFEADPAVVLDTLKTYDMAVMGQNDFPDVGKAIATRTVGDVEKNEDGSYNVDSYDLENTTVRVRLMAPSTHHTMGGVVVDIDRRVLDKDGNVIPGLYAAGEVTGGIHGGNRLGGNAITEIFVSGRTAAMAVTEDNK